MGYRNSIAAFLLGLILCAFVPGPAWAASYYMSPSGNDGNPGTEAAPWRTLDRLHQAQSSLRSGDTVYFKGGDYLVTNTNRNWFSWRADGVTYRNYNGEKATIVYDRIDANNESPPYSVTFLFISGDSVVIDGLSFVQSDRSFSSAVGPGPSGNIMYTNRPSRKAALAVYGERVIFRNSSVLNFSGVAMAIHGSNNIVETSSISSANHAFYIQHAKNTVVRFNHIAGVRSIDSQHLIQVQWHGTDNTKIYGNLVVNGSASGITFSGGIARTEFFNNVVINGGSGRSAGYAISFACEDGMLLPGNKVYNNTFIGSSVAALIAGGTCTTGLTRCDFHASEDREFMTDAECAAELARKRPMVDMIEVYDNIFYPTPSLPVSLIPADLNRSLPTVKNNIFYNIRGSVPAGNTLIDPKLVNPNGNTAADAALQPSSPAIDAGRNAGFPPFDFETKPRPAGAAYDIGAFEGGYEGRIPMPPPIGVPPAVPRPPSTYDPGASLCPR